MFEPGDLEIQIVKLASTAFKVPIIAVIFNNTSNKQLLPLSDTDRADSEFLFDAF